MGLRDLLTACQVHQVQFPRQLCLCLHILLLDVDEKDAVAARAVLIHVCRTKHTSQPLIPCGNMSSYFITFQQQEKMAVIM